MSKSVFFASSSLMVVFVLSIIIGLLSGCASSSSAPVFDKSLTSIKRPLAHVVTPGDTLFSIAWRYGLKYEALATHNRIKPPYLIRPSQVIRLDVSVVVANPVGRPAVASKSQQPVSAPQNAHSKVDASAKKSQIKQTHTQASKQKNKQSNNILQWRWPTAGPLLSSFQGNSGLNKGIDLGGKLGEPVISTASGRVVYSGSGLRGYGKLLIIKHNETFLSAYAHNNILKVKEGDFVKAGQIIAEMGSSGTDRIKLHFEIRQDGVPVDPMRFLPRR